MLVIKSFFQLRLDCAGSLRLCAYAIFEVAFELDWRVVEMRENVLHFFLIGDCFC